MLIDFIRVSRENYFERSGIDFKILNEAFGWISLYQIYCLVPGMYSKHTELVCKGEPL